MSKIIPIALLQWAKHDWVSTCIKESSMPLMSIINEDINKAVTSTGSTLLHLVTMNASKPSPSIACNVANILLELGANPNAKDNYDRTPLTNLITQSSSVLHHNEEFGLMILKDLIANDADVNVLFTPDYINYSGCDKWTLAHDLLDIHHGKSRWSLPESVLEIINEKIDFSIPDSTGRKPISNKLSA